MSTIDLISTDSNNTQKLQRAIELDGWRLERLTVFFRSETTCPACRMLQKVYGTVPSLNLHARIDGDLMVLTEVNDIHEPGFTMCARMERKFGTAVLFRLLNAEPPALRLWRFSPGSGLLRLSRPHGLWRLTCVGQVDQLHAFHGTLFDAIEVPCH